MDENVVVKPWGSYKDYFRDSQGKCVFKMIVINAGEEISYQLHERRGEFWYIASGNALIKSSPFGADSALTNYTMTEMSEGDFIVVPEGQPHQLINNGAGDLIIYEMQFGDCSEVDIIRLADKYDRQ